MALTQVSTQGIKDGTITGSDLATNVDLVDDQKLRLGNSQDLQIFHSGGDNFIKGNASTSRLFIDSCNEVQIRHLDTDGSNSEKMIVCNDDGAVELYHDNSKKLETTSSGVQVGGSSTNLIIQEGTVSASAGGMITFKNTDGNGIQRDVVRIKGFTGNSTGGYGELTLQTAFNNTLNDCLIIRKDKNVELPNDNQRLKIGAGQDLQIYHDGTNSFIKDTAGAAFSILATESIAIKTNNTEFAIACNKNGGVELYFNNSLRLSTTANGVTLGHNLLLDNATNAGRDVTWDPANDQLQWKDNTKASFGSNSDLQIFHDGGHSFIHQDGTGGLKILADTFRLNNEANTENIISGDANGGVELYHNNSKMLDTSAQGVNFRGEIRSATTSSSLSNCTLKNESTGADGTDYFQCRTDNNTLKLVIEPDGDVKNQNTSYGGLSDLKLKENIVDANSQWNDIKAIKVRNFNFKESTGFSTHTQIGVVAQELETSSPNLVYESIDRDPATGEDLGTKTKNVRYSVMYMKAIKCLQEAMAKIEVLETEVTALKAG